MVVVNFFRVVQCAVVSMALCGAIGCQRVNNNEPVNGDSEVERQLDIGSLQRLIGKDKESIQKEFGEPIDIGATDYVAPSDSATEAEIAKWRNETTGVIFVYDNVEVHFNLDGKVIAALSR